MATACWLSGTSVVFASWSPGMKILRLAEVRVGWNSPHGIVNINFRPAGISSSLERIKTSKFSITASRVTGGLYNRQYATEVQAGVKDPERAMLAFYRGQCTSHIQSRVILMMPDCTA